MNFNALVSILKSGKQTIPLDKPSESFAIVDQVLPAFIEPEFDKIEFESERPSVVLISAVGCAGKTTLSRQLSCLLQIPVLDLAVHKAVADNTLTGILTTHYKADRIGDVLKGLAVGAHAVLIDGLDEARTKTTDQGFDAFLDNIVELAKNSPRTSIVILGRGQVLEVAWCYLAERCNVGLLQMQPFSIDNATAYVDKKVSVPEGQIDQYTIARELLFSKLQGAFTGLHQDGFAQFLGYPPVLDSIAALLNEERNYHKLCQNLDQCGAKDHEVELLRRIADYLLHREHRDKAVPNFCSEIASKAANLGLVDRLYAPEEQCKRLLAFVLDAEVTLGAIDDPILDAEYEEKANSFLQEHPFLIERKFRNPVFEAAVLATCCSSNSPVIWDLCNRYALTKRLTYHLFFFLQQGYNGGSLPRCALNLAMQSCADFLSTSATLEVNVSGPMKSDIEDNGPVEVDVEVVIQSRETSTQLHFSTSVSVDDRIQIGPVLVNSNIVLPCTVELSSEASFECFGENSLETHQLQFSSKRLAVASLRGHRKEQIPPNLTISADQVAGNVDEVGIHEGTIEIISPASTLYYPLVKFRADTSSSSDLEALPEAYFRLRRIMLEFRSHSKGQLAKYKPKIEHARVLKNDLGKAVLAKLIGTGVLTSDTKFYFVDQSNFSKVLGVTWHDLRCFKRSPPLDAFLESF